MRSISFWTRERHNSSYKGLNVTKTLADIVDMNGDFYHNYIWCFRTYYNFTFCSGKHFTQRNIHYTGFTCIYICETKQILSL